MSVETIGFLLVVGLFLFGAYRFVRRVTVFDYEHAVRFDKGAFAGTLPPGVFWIFTPYSTIRKLDARLQILTVPGQELLSSDGVTLKVSVLAEYRIVDPQQAVLAASDYIQVLYSKVQTALRDYIGSREIEQILAARAELSNLLRTAVAPQLQPIGLELSDATLKDIMFPGALKEAFSRTARAKQDAHAALEKARGEAASLRKLANAARMLDDNPQLFRLRLLQSVSESGKLVLSISDQD